jgi:tRNA-modifying protein YgfZ
MRIEESIMLADTTTYQQEYQALRAGAALQRRPAGGILALTDADRVDFLQRMTTNDVKALAGTDAAGQTCVTVLTSPTAKILQVFTVLARAGDLLLLPALGETAALARHLRGQIFFMDKVKVSDVSPQFARLRLVGPQALTAVAATGLDMQGAGEGEWRGRDGLLVVAQRQYDLPGFEIVVDQARQEEIVTRLAAVGVVVLDGDEAYQARRIELGRPEPGAELTGEYSPLEGGLAWACAENKGCYTGQEIIARQITYDKVTRVLVGLVGDTPLSPGASLSADGRDVGTVTSAAYSPLLNSPVALAIVKRPHDAPGSKLQSENTPVRVTALPFSAAPTADDAQGS